MDNVPPMYCAFLCQMCSTTIVDGWQMAGRSVKKELFKEAPKSATIYEGNSFCSNSCVRQYKESQGRYFV